MTKNPPFNNGFKALGALGSLKLPLWGDKHYLVVGGPYTNRPPAMVGVKMAAEIRRPCDIDIPTQDFRTPDEDDLREGLTEAVKAIAHGECVYVGCMAGRGRTGLFLSVLAKAFGVAQPIEYVREHYYPHAVETDDQYEFVMNFPIPVKVRLAVAVARGKSFFTGRKCLTNV